MTPILDQMIKHPMAWKGTDIRSKQDIEFLLTDKHRDAILAILGDARALPVEAITREQCRHPALDTDFASVLDEVQTGRGIVLLRRVPIEGQSLEDIQRIDWIINTHLGTALSQNGLGHRITMVQDERLPDGVATARGHKSSQELAMHTDNSEIFTLLSVRTAKEGGATQFSSALAVHNDLLEHRPDVLPILYRGFPNHRRGDQPDGQPMVTPYDMPIFSNVDGYVSVCLVIGSIMGGLAELGRELGPAEREAIDVMHESMMRQYVEICYEPGEMSIVNNLTMLHSRTQYVDWEEPDRKRLLLRMWLEAARDSRPTVPEIRVYENAGGRFGCDPVPGRSHSRNDYQGLSEKMREIIKGGQARRVVER
jgi:hypothetical protein